MTRILTVLTIMGGAVFMACPEAPFEEDLDYAQIVFVKATQKSSNLWSFDVTVRHNDEGWTHYADAWQVVDPSTMKILTERVLLHPHESEQPFTRSQNSFTIPAELDHVLVRAKCNVHGFGGREVLLPLRGSRKTDLFEVIGGK